MRFDTLLAVISSGLYAPLALMAGGFVLAVGGLIFLFWYRKRITNPSQRAANVADDAPFDTMEADELAEPDFSSPPSATPTRSEAAAPAAAQGGRRRRSLVGGAEREDGTPAGEPAPQEEPSFEPSVEEAQYDEYEAETDSEFSSDSDGLSDYSNDDPAESYESSEHEQVADDSEYEWSESLSDDEAESEVQELVEPDWVEPDVAETAEPSEFDLDAEAEIDAEDVAAVEETSQDVSIADAAGLAVAGSASAGVAASAMMDEADEPSSDEIKLPLAAEVLAARKRPVVFRQFLPQSPLEDGLSFFGGQPIGPDDFVWPRQRGNQGGSPLQFIMQWDCSLLSQEDPTGLIPQTGVLYCFVNCDHSGDEDFLASHTFIHHRGAVEAWRPIPTPEDAGPALGKSSASLLSGCTDKVSDGDSHCPHTLPRFPFASIGFDYGDSDGAANPVWDNDQAAQSLLAVQKTGVAAQEASRAEGLSQDEIGRPFPSFPHDFGAVRVMASRIIEALDKPDDFLAETLYPELDKEARAAQFAAWSDEAKEVYLLGTQRPAGHRLDQSIADDIWHWFEGCSGILGSDTADVFAQAVDLSLGIGSEALSTVPAHWIDKAMQSHVLATEFDADKPGNDAHFIRTRTPARMFGPPSAGSAEAMAHADEDILLLELPNGAGPQHHFRGRTLQYWISPDDLAAGKFDQVKATIVQS